MNERIKKLASQCYELTKPDLNERFNKEKFAELIVKECIDIVVEYSEDGAHCQRQMIKERFGVE